MKLLLAAAAIGTLAVGGYNADLHWNLTPSMPRGLWRMEAFHPPVQRGEVVALCLPEAAAALGWQRGYLDAGDCPGGSEAVLKTIAAIPGDRVDVSANGIIVNGLALEHSAPLARDEANRMLFWPLPGLYVVRDTEIWIVGGNDPRSYDSRYFGAVPIAGIQGRMVPFLIVSQ